MIQSPSAAKKGQNRSRLEIFDGWLFSKMGFATKLYSEFSSEVSFYSSS
jgi:hypothetical protein